LMTLNALQHFHLDWNYISLNVRKCVV
jgi:hypothetical protein